MKIGLRILIGYFLILGLSAWLVLNVLVAEVSPGVRATLEDTLVDTSQLLAQLVALDVKNGDLSSASTLTKIQNFSQRSIDANIVGVKKQALSYRITITDQKGIVIFDTDHKDVGKDYSQWNDVYRTLRGQYGARSTRLNKNDENSSVMHVAAPILDVGDSRKIIGVLTVSKANSTIQPFIERSQNKIIQQSIWLWLASLCIGIGFSWWLSHSLQKLKTYALLVQNDEKATLPKLGNNEIGELGLALESMRNQLEGKAYAQQLMHTLFHELKSPIAAIQGSAELLQEEMPVEDKKRFLHNIIEQNNRQKKLIDNLLDLIKLEKQQSINLITPIQLDLFFDQIKTDVLARLTKKSMTLNFENEVGYLYGDEFLLRQAIGNLIDNAIEFSSENSAINVISCTEIVQNKKWINIKIIDQGAGIPIYALDKIFDRFYSLPRPDKEKSTGLGLPFVKEIIALHGGKIQIVNSTNSVGVTASISLPT